MIGFWSAGVSRAGKIMPASAVNMIGRIKGNVVTLKGVMNAGHILVEAKA